MEERDIAPCGMNCSLCVSYQAREKDLNSKGFHRGYCPGCIERGKHCLHMADNCKLMRDGTVRYCFECDKYPCPRLKLLDKRYRTRYHMSMIANLNAIRAEGIDDFLAREKNLWKCPTCGGNICCHNGLCLDCQLEVFKKKKTYCWDKNSVTMEERPEEEGVTE